MASKAFLKKIFNFPAFGESCNFSIVFLVACMILSAPSFTPAPSCLDENSLADSDCAFLAMHFASKRRMTSPQLLDANILNSSMQSKKHCRKLVPLEQGVDTCKPNSRTSLGL